MRISDWSSDVCSSDLPEQSLLHDLGEADNGIQRRAQLMAHVREEGRLGVVRPLGLVAGDAQLPLLVLDLADIHVDAADADGMRSEEHTSELQSLMRISYAVFCLKKKKKLQKAPVIHYNTTQYTVNK